MKQQTNIIIYAKNEKLVDRALRSAYFCDLEKRRTAYQLEAPDHNQPALPGRDRCLAGKAVDAPISLRLPRQVFRQEGFRADPDYSTQTATTWLFLGGSWTL